MFTNASEIYTADGWLNRNLVYAKLTTSWDKQDKLKKILRLDLN